METVLGLFTDPQLVCPACGSSEWKNSGQAKDYTVSGEWFELKECPVCQLKATFPQPPENQIGRYYASQSYISHSDTRSGMTNKLFHKARTIMLHSKHKWVTEASGKSSGTLLDIGAGTGYFAKYMQDAGWAVKGLEPDETARKVAMEKHGLELLPMGSLALQPTSSCDVITLWHVLEHVYDVTGYMRHFSSLLTENGLLVIAVPNHRSRDAKQYGNSWAAYDVPRHVWHFSPLSMEKLLHRHGFVLFRKNALPLDAFYVSMLSERYKGNDFFSPLTAFFSGIKTWVAENRNIDKASSIVYFAKKRSA